MFIAGGAGVAIMKNLAEKGELKGNKLLFANKTRKDIIIKEQFEKWLGDDFINILSDESSEGYAQGYIDIEFLQSYLGSFDQYIYLCGPPAFMEDVEKALKELRIPEEQLVK